MLRISCLMLVLSCCMAWIGSAAAAEPKKGDVIVVSKGGRYVQVEVVEAKPPFITVKEKGSNSTFTTQTAFVLVPEEGYELLTAKTVVKKGDTFKAKSGFKWSDVKVVEVAGNSVKIKWEDRPTFPPSEVTKFSLARTKSASKEPASPELAGLAGKRTWTDASGKFKIEASYAGLSDEKVQLKKADGKTISLPLEKLSIADREIAQLLAKSQPAGEPEDVDPFAMAAKEDATEADEPTKPDEPTSDKSSDDPEYKALAADWPEAFEVSLRAAGPFSLPAASLTLPEGKFADHSITLSAPPSRGFSSSIDVIPSPSRKQVIVVFDDGAHATSRYRFNLCDTEKGKMLGDYSFPGRFRPFAFDDATKRLLTFTEAWPRDTDHADLWEIDEKTTTVKHVLRWNPLDGKSFGPNTAIRKAHLVGDDLVWLLDTKGRFTLWQLSKAKAVYFGQLPSEASDVQFTPDGKYCVAVMQGTLGIFEAATGKALGQSNVASSLGNVWRISPDGKHIATLAKESLKVFEIASNQLAHEVFMPSNNGLPPSTLEWAGNNYLLVNSTQLVDPALGVVVWNYSRPGATGPALKSFGGLFWSVKGDSRFGERPSLISAALPHPGVKDAVVGLDPQKLSVFQPGTKVRIDLQLPTLPEPDQQKVLASLTQALGEVGATVSPDGEMVMTCVSKTGKPEAVAFGQRGFGLRTTITANTVFTPNSYSLELKDKNGVVWSTWHTTSPPGGVVLKPGQTVESFVQEASQPSPSFFLKIKFHNGMKRPGPYHGAYGESQL